MLWQLGIGFLGGMVYGLMDADKKKENYSVAPKAEPINDLTDEQIKRILLTPKVKKIIEDIIKSQSGVVNVFDPEWYYNNKDNNDQLFKSYDRIMNSYRRAQDYHEGKLNPTVKPSYKLTIEDDKIKKEDSIDNNFLKPDSDENMRVQNVFENEEEEIQAMQRLNEECAKEIKKYNYKPYILKIEDD